MAKENAFKLRAIIDSLTQYADRAQVDRQAGIRGMHVRCSRMPTKCPGLGDDVIVKVWNTALRYIEGVGMTDTYDIEVVKYHFQTIAIILDMPEEAPLHRTSVANELERLVNKRSTRPTRRSPTSPDPFRLPNLRLIAGRVLSRAGHHDGYRSACGLALKVSMASSTTGRTLHSPVVKSYLIPARRQRKAPAPSSII